VDTRANYTPNKTLGHFNQHFNMSKPMRAQAPNPNKAAKKLPPIPQPKQKAKKKGTKQQRKQRKEIARLPRRVHFSDCSRLYLRSVLDPWDVLNNEDSLPCLPDEFDQPSFKYATRARGTLTVGTTTGFVLVSPMNAINTTSNICYTDSSYAGLSFQAVGTGTNLVTDGQLLPASAATAPNSRLVACGLRVRYTGTELNRGGQVLPARALPSGDNLNGSTISDCLQRQDHATKPCSRGWVGTVWYPTYAAATEFALNNNSVSTGTNQRLGVLVTGTTGNTYEWDFVRFWEVVADTSVAGTPTLSPVGITKSHSDLTGLGWVRDYLGGLSVDDYGKVAYDAGIRYVSGIAVKGVASFVSGLY